MAATIKRGDKGDTLTLTVNMDLTDCVLRLLAQSKYGIPRPDVIELDVDEAASDRPEGVVVHITEGDLDVGDYDIELEATRGDEIFSFPTIGFELLRVREDLG